MLIEFSVGNYRSFKEKVTFSMVAANIVAKDKSLDENNVFAVDTELKLLKSAAIYIKGRYGAIPYIGNFNSLIDSHV